MTDASELAAPFDVYRDRGRPEWIDHESTFCLEAHVTYHREVRTGDPLRFTTRLLAHDAKRLHYFPEMYHGTEGYLVLARLARIQKSHDALPRPPQVGRTIGLTSPPTTR
jgi:acyl-CoA thioester hydrolase